MTLDAYKLRSVRVVRVVRSIRSVRSIKAVRAVPRQQDHPGYEQKTDGHGLEDVSYLEIELVESRIGLVGVVLVVHLENDPGLGLVCGTECYAALVV